MSLSQRPLLSGESQLFVDREAEIRRIERSIGPLEANVLVAGPPGSGRTSLLRRLVGRSQASGKEWAYVDGSAWSTLDEVLAAVSAALGRDRRNRPRYVDPEDLEWERSMVRIDVPRVVTERDVLGAILPGAPRVIALDGLPAVLAFDLFGRFRDTLWEAPHRWVVTADEVHREAFLRPPADVFFETVVDLDELRPELVGELLDRRADTLEDELDRDRLRGIATVLRQGGQPSRHPGTAISIAREAMMSDLPVAHLVQLRQDAEERAGRLGDAALSVFEALRELGDVHAGDERLLHRVGLSRARVVQVLKELEEDGLVEARRHGRRVLYRCAPAEASL